MAIKIDSNVTPSLGGILLRLRGATQNLREAMSTNDSALILKRRTELFEVVYRLKKIDQIPILDSLTISHIIHNIDIAVITATTMLRDASSHLSAQLALA